MTNTREKLVEEMFKAKWSDTKMPKEEMEDILQVVLDAVERGEIIRLCECKCGTGNPFDFNDNGVCKKCKDVGYVLKEEFRRKV